MVRDPSEKAQLGASQPHRARPRTFLFIIFLILGLLTTAVPVVSWLNRPHGGEFTGHSYESVGDIFVYLNLIDQAKHGAVLFENFFTPEVQKPMLFQPLFLILGHLADWANLSSLVVWHLARVAFFVPLLWIFWLCADKFYQEEKKKRLALLFLAGAGAIASTTNEGSSFLMMLYSPKAVMTLWFTLLFFYLFLRMYERRLTALGVSTMFFVSFFQAFLQPYVLLLWAVAPAIFFFVEYLLGRFRWRSLGVVLVGTTAPVALALLSLGATVLRDPLLAAWSQNAYGPPYPWYVYALDIGGLLPLAVLGVYRERSRFAANPYLRFFVILFFTALGLSLSPYPYSYRLFGYMQQPLALFAAAGAIGAWELSRSRPVWRAILLFFLVLCVTDNARHMGINLTGGYFQSTENRYLSADDVAAMRWLRENTPMDSRILSSPAWDTLLAQQAYRHVFTTSGWQTNMQIRRMQEALAVYQGDDTPVELDAFLRNNTIHYLVVTEREKREGSWISFNGGEKVYDFASSYGFQPERYSFLHKVYANASFLIYRYQASDDPTIL